MIEIHILNLLRTDSHKNIILVVIQELIGRRLHIVVGFKRNGLRRELVGLILFLIERIGQRSTIIMPFRLETVSVVTIGKPMRTEVGGRLSCCSQTQTIDEVGGDDRG